MGFMVTEWGIDKNLSQNTPDVEWLSGIVNSFALEVECSTVVSNNKGK